MDNDELCKFGWLYCTNSRDERFTKGTAYEVVDYGPTSITVTTDTRFKFAKVEQANAAFRQYDPWESYRATRPRNTERR